jgi:hypothetical protein
MIHVSTGKCGHAARSMRLKTEILLKLIDMTEVSTIWEPGMRDYRLMDYCTGYRVTGLPGDNSFIKTCLIGHARSKLGMTETY